MFIVEAVGSREIFNNGLKDDFLQFLPNHFGCEPQEITAHYVEDSAFETWKKRNRNAEFEVLLDASSPTVNVTHWVQGPEIAPTLSVGDDDSASTGATILEGDKRTLPSFGPPVRELLLSLSGKKIVGWPYEITRVEGEEGVVKFLPYVFEDSDV